MSVAAVDGVRGGLLADKMGYGKTCTTIALIASTRQNQGALPQHDGYFSTAATLILAPLHLMKQWEDEFTKFMGVDNTVFWHFGNDYCDYICRQRNGCMKPENGFKCMKPRAANVHLGFKTPWDSNGPDPRLKVLVLNSSYRWKGCPGEHFYTA